MKDSHVIPEPMLWEPWNVTRLQKDFAASGKIRIVIQLEEMGHYRWISIEEGDSFCIRPIIKFREFPHNRTLHRFSLQAGTMEQTLLRCGDR